MHSKLNKSLAYDILPVSFTNENTKRTIKYDSFANFHIGKKRSIDLPNLICNVNSLIGEKSKHIVYLLLYIFLNKLFFKSNKAKFQYQIKAIILKEQSIKSQLV